MNRAKIFIAFTFLLIFAVCVSAQDGFVGIPSLKETIKLKETSKIEIGDVSPNELEGFTFFGEGKLNKLKLGVSTRDDVEKIFGKAKSKYYNNSWYDYDSDWLIQIVYFDDQRITRSRSVGRRTVNLVPSPEFVGKIDYIKFQPKKNISLAQIVFSDAFDKQSMPFGGYDLYEDIYGLKYKIFDKSISNDSSKNISRTHGDLIEIEYEIPHRLQDKIFLEIEQK